METQEIVYVPAGNKNGAPIEVDFGALAKIEARIQEVASVTPQKAPELLATFNRAALDMDRLSHQLELEYQLSVRDAERIRGEVILDRAPTILKQKGLTTDRNPAGSEDLRNAVLANDKEYLEAMDRSDFIRAMQKIIRGKYDAFERAFRSVRTMVGEATFSFSNRNLSGDTGDAEVGESLKSRFGTPNYGKMK